MRQSGSTWSGMYYTKTASGWRKGSKADSGKEPVFLNQHKHAWPNVKPCSPTYLLASGTWPLEPQDCLGEHDQQGQSQLWGGQMRMVGGKLWLSLLPTLPDPGPPALFLPGPTKGGPPTMGGTTVAAAAARASRVCWTYWEGELAQRCSLVPAGSP